jgi:hypothetical protein
MEFRRSLQEKLGEHEPIEVKYKKIKKSTG